MRYFLFILLISFTANSFPNYLEGNYYDTYRGMIGGKWHFNKDGTFDYSEDNCTGGNVGKGNYLIEKDSIHIRFVESKDSTLKSSTIEAILTDSTKARWGFSIKVSDEQTDEILPFVLILLKDSSGKILKNLYSDVNGNTMFIIPDYNGKVSICVNCIGYDKGEYPLSQKGNYDVKVKMASNFRASHIEAGTAWDYRILKSDKQKIIWETTYPEESRNIYSKKVVDTIELKRE